MDDFDDLVAKLPLCSLGEPVPYSFYDDEYFLKGTKSNYRPYGPGEWLDGLVFNVQNVPGVKTVLDVGCAYGFVVKELVECGYDAWGFDCSEFAISRSVIPERTYVGYLEYSVYWRDADLVLVSEVLEHLVWHQIRLFFRNAAMHTSRILALVALGDGGVDLSDRSHVTMVGRDFWDGVARKFGFENNYEFERWADDLPVSARMNWCGRIFLWEKKYL